jgi:seryl-tRNA synthetase
MRMSQSIKSPIHFDFDRPEDLTDRHHEFMASTAHLNPLPEGNLYKVMVDNMEERERRKRELKTQLEGFKSENEELKDRIRELLAKLTNPTVTLAELEAIKRELNKIIKERDMLNENLKLTT